MNDSQLQIEFDFGDDLAVDADEVQLVEALLPELLQDMLWLQSDPND